MSTPRSEPRRRRQVGKGSRPWPRAEPESSNTVFGTFDNNLAGYLDEVSQDTSNSLAAEQPAMVVAPSSSSLADWRLRSGRWGVALG